MKTGGGYSVHQKGVRRLSLRKKGSPKLRKVATALAVDNSLTESTFNVADDHVPYDENLLERAHTLWQFGDWDSLGKIDRETIQHHPDRARLALLAAAGNLQKNDLNAARQLAGLAMDWGCTRSLVSRVLISGVYNTLGRAAAISHQAERSFDCFKQAISIVVPTNTSGLLIKVREAEQLRQIGLTPQLGHVNEISGGKAKLYALRVSPIHRSDKDSYLNSDIFSSAQYWDDRYKDGGTSGYGSYGRLAEFKAEIINKFIEEKSIDSVIEFGCGDGNQLSMIRVNSYVGIDVSPTVIDKCKDRFKFDKSKVFLTTVEYFEKPRRGDIGLSLDVIFHLVEDDVFEEYMNVLFDSSDRYCLIYSCDEDDLESDAEHVRRRRFSVWIANNKVDWRLIRVVYNKYPHDGSPNPKDCSFSNFYIYERLV